MRHMYLSLFVVALTWGCGSEGAPGLSDASSSAQASSDVPGPREHFVRLEIDSRDEIKTLTRAVSIDRVDGLSVSAYASDDQLLQLKALGYRFTELAHPGKNPNAVMGALTRGAVNWSAYPTYAEYVSMMQGWAKAYPNLCRLENIGRTTNTKRPHAVWVMKITSNPDVAADKPEVFYSSTMHGDETTGYVSMLHLIDDLLAGYGKDAETTRLVDTVEIWVNPLANPDGTYYGGDATVSNAIRGFVNANGGYAGVDPNRNYPELGNTYPTQDSGRWLETQEMMNFMSAHHFTLSANFHGGAEVVNYPWDSREALHADDAWFLSVSRAYADRAHKDGPNGYMTELQNGVTNGYAWYEVDGGRQDFMTYFLGGRELTIELSGTKNPSASQLPTFWRANRGALLGYFAQALAGVRGVVTDAGGAPLAAKIEVVGHDVTGDRSAVSTDPVVGDYHRPIVPGSYTLRFSAPGFASQDISDVVVNDSAEATRVDVVLAPTTSQGI